MKLSWRDFLGEVVVGLVAAMPAVVVLLLLALVLYLMGRVS
jgi:hypothetical protein